MSGASLRDRLNKELGGPPVSEELWEVLALLGHVAAVEEGQEGAFEDLVTEARRFRMVGAAEYTGHKPPTGRKPKGQVSELQPALGEDTQARLEALRDYYRTRGAAPVGPLAPRVRVRRSAGTISNSLTIELEIPAWLPAEEVEDLYRQAQAEALRGRDSAPLEPKTLRVFRFCLPHMILAGSAEDVEHKKKAAEREKREQEPIDYLADDKPRRPWSWQRLMKAWNAEYPDDDQFETYSGFRRAYYWAKAALVRPALPWPEARTETVTLPDGTRRTYGGLATE